MVRLNPLYHALLVLALVTGKPEYSIQGQAQHAYDTQIIFVSGADSYAEIYAMNADGSNRRQLTYSKSWNGEPAVSPDGTQVAFVSYRDGNKEICVMAIDGSQQRNLTRSSDDDWSPQWSPDGESIAFVSDRNWFPAVYVMRADGADPEPLIDYAEAPVSTTAYFCWSPDSQSIVTANGGPYYGYWLKIVRRGGGKPIDRQASIWDSRPAWSPDGQMLAYGHSFEGGLYIANLAQPGERQLVKGESGFPSWSPDGRYLASVLAQGDQVGLYLFDVQASSSRYVVLKHLLSDQGVSWSPDSQAVAFVAIEQGNPQIYVMRLADLVPRQITYTTAANLSPVWITLAASHNQ